MSNYKKYGEDDDFQLFLKETEPLREFVRLTRNCIEHEKPDKRVVIANFRMNPSAEIVLPTLELIHPDCPRGEVSVRALLQSLFSELVDFSEALLAHMVAKNINNKKDGFIFDLIYYPEGSPQNSNIRYGFGVMLNGKLTPVG